MQHHRRMKIGSKTKKTCKDVCVEDERQIGIG